MLLHSRDSTESVSIVCPLPAVTELGCEVPLDTILPCWRKLYTTGYRTYNHIRILASAWVRDSSTRGMPKLHSLPGELRVEGIRGDCLLLMTYIWLALMGAPDICRNNPQPGGSQRGGRKMFSPNEPNTLSPGCQRSFFVSLNQGTQDHPQNIREKRSMKGLTSLALQSWVKLSPSWDLLALPELLLTEVAFNVSFLYQLQSASWSQNCEKTSHLWRFFFFFWSVRKYYLRVNKPLFEVS